jgi:hypothetical protein
MKMHRWLKTDDMSFNFHSFIDTLNNFNLKITEIIFLDGLSIVTN